MCRPDYDMSGFYRDKGPGVRPKIGGYTISNTGGNTKVSDPSKKAIPGVGHYETKLAHEKTTFYIEGPSYSVPQDGAFSIEVCMQRASSTNRNKKRAG